MKFLLIIGSACGLFLLAACAEEQPPISVSEFMQNPRLLEATMVRCARNRSETKYNAECLNARDAVNRLEAASERERREQLEAQSESKRQALRRTQEAAAEARRRRLEAQRLREEAEYLGLFEEVPASTEAGQVMAPAGDQTMPANGATTAPVTGEPARSIDGDTSPQTGTDLNAVREELRRRQDPVE
jgi:septal ring factor EnvC (AmiA/AmiB activator)